MFLCRCAKAESGGNSPSEPASHGDRISTISRRNHRTRRSRLHYPDSPRKTPARHCSSRSSRNRSVWRSPVRRAQLQWASARCAARDDTVVHRGRVASTTHRRGARARGRIPKASADDPTLALAVACRRLADVAHHEASDCQIDAPLPQYPRISKRRLNAAANPFAPLTTGYRWRDEGLMAASNPTSYTSAEPSQKCMAYRT